MDERAFDEIMTRLDTPMVVVTTANGEERAGCLVGFHAQSGLDPRSLSVWLSKANHTYRVATMADTFAVHFLAASDVGIARLFGEQTGDEVDKFEQCRWHEGPGGVPVLDGCDHRVVGAKVAMLDAGVDHVCLVLDPIEAVSDGDFMPMHLSTVADLDPGHAAEERPEPPSTRAGS